MKGAAERMRLFRFSGCCAAFALLLLTGCAGHQQSVVDPGGPQAGRIAGLWWFFLWLLTAIFIVVMAFTLWTLLRRHRGIEQEPLAATHLPSEQTERKLTRVVTGATIATVVILFILLGVSIFAGKAIANLGNTKNSMVVAGTVRQSRRQPRSRHRQRDSHTGRPPGDDSGQVERRHP